MAIWGSSGGTVGKTLRYLDLNWSIHHLKGWRGKSFSLDLWFSTMIFYHIYHWWRGKSWKITWIHSSHDFLPRYRGFQLQWSITDGILGCCLCLLIQGQVMFWKEQTCAKRVEEWWAQIEIRLYIYIWLIDHQRISNMLFQKQEYLEPILKWWKNDNENPWTNDEPNNDVSWLNRLQSNAGSRSPFMSLMFPFNPWRVELLLDCRFQFGSLFLIRLL